MSTDDTAFEAARTLFLRGLERHEAGAWAEAEALYRASLAQLPGRPSTLTNLAATLVSQGRSGEALALVHQALQAEPDNAEALAQHALVLAALGQDVEALPAFDAAIAAAPGNAALHGYRGLCRARLNRPAEALADFDAALAIDDTRADLWAWRGGLLKDTGRRAEAVQSLERAIAGGADGEENRYLLASLTGRSVPPAAPARYVQALFDGYAADFDAHLTGALQYRVPEQLAQLAARHGAVGGMGGSGGSGGFGAALDLGCGTGLAAPALAALTSELHGVDLSPGMLAQARATARYAALWQDDIAAHLAASDQRYGLVLAADVFIYVGDLRAVFAGVQRVLQPGGLFCFSVEPAASGHDHALLATSRYAHGAPYLRRLAAAHAFDVLAAETTTLRLDQGRPLAGQLWVLRAVP